VNKPDIKTIQEQLVSFLRSHELYEMVDFYDQAAWRARGEDVGRSAILTMTFEGPVYRIMNYPNDKIEDKWQQAIYDIIEDFGCMAELGYAWSMHIYPLEE
jgi:hypothetical protein